jgi:GT2 family glycosyltransferase
MPTHGNVGRVTMGVLPSGLDREPVDVSVVIPTFRRPAPLVEAVRSALAQEGARVHVHVFDDCPDGSASETIASIRDSRVTYERRATSSRGKPARVRNEGWRSTRANVVHFLDDDDRVLPGVYRDALAVFARAPNVGVVFGRVLPFGDSPITDDERVIFARAAAKARHLQKLGSRFLFIANQLYSAPTLLVNSACLVRRGLIDIAGGYDESLPVMEDLDFYVRAIRAGGCMFLDRPFIEYRTGHTSLMRSAEAVAVTAAYRRIYEHYRERYGAIELLAMKVLGKTLVSWL